MDKNKGKNKKKILVVNAQYLPGFKGGGPIQSCENLIENLSEEFEFYVLCADRDLKDTEPYKNIKINDWNKVGSANVFYMSADKQKLKDFKKVLNETNYDILYLNGFFSPTFTQKPLLLKYFGKLKNKNIILTPRGDFTGGCENKKLKKYAYIYLVRLMGLYNNIIWQAASKIEEQDIKKKFPKAKVYIIPNLPKKVTIKKPIIQKKQGELRLIFVSRMFPKKNLKYALEVLKGIKEGNVIYDIYGPMEDKNYWNKCEQVIKELPSNVKVNYCGELPHAEIPHAFEQYHAFLFPTLGENYGHVIVEAMMNNCLPILSKGTTPWDEYIDMLQIGARLEEKEKFINIINKLININQEEIQKMIEINNTYIRQKFDITEDMKKYVEVFNKEYRKL